MNMLYNAIVISGATGVGKTNLSIKLAKILNAEIISADSMQVYKGLDIGTAKIRKDEMQGIKHYMLDIVEPDYEYSVGEYEKTVNNILNNYKDKFFILVGGTGLYLSSVTDGFSELPNKDDKIREELENRDLDDLLNELKILDIDSYNTIDRNNKVRVVRALEVCKITGRKFSEIINKNNKGNDRKFLKIFLTREREEIYQRINDRIDIMLDEGLLEEAKNIYNKYPLSKAIGYKELFDYFKGIMSLDEAIRLLKQKTRNYAKRQLTWFNAKDDYIKYNLNNISEDDVINDILKIMKSEEK